MKHQKHNYNFLEDNSTICEPVPLLFHLLKPFHEDPNAPSLVLTLEQSSDDKSSTLVSKATSEETSAQSASIEDKFKFANIADSSMKNLEPFAQECLHLFNGEFTVMNNKSKSEETSEESDQNIELLFPRFKPMSKHVLNHPSTFSRTQQLFIKSYALRLQSKFTEPLFCSLELVDIKHKKRISERIWFHRNSFAMMNDFYEDLEMKRKAKEHGITGGNAIFSVTNQRNRHNDIYVVLWIWRTLSAHTFEQIYGKAALFGKKNATLVAGSNGFVDEDFSDMTDVAMPADHLGLKQYLTPFCVSFAPLLHRGNTPSMNTVDNIDTVKNSKQPYGHDGFLIAMTHFLPPCSYFELFNTLIPSIGSMCSVSVTSRTSPVTQNDILLSNYLKQQLPVASKKHKGVPGWFLFQVQAFNAHLYEKDHLYRAYMLYMDNNLGQRLSSGSSLQLQDALHEIQTFNENKYKTILQQEQVLVEQEQEFLKKLQGKETSLRRRSGMNLPPLQETLCKGSMPVVANVLNSSNQHLRKEPKSYMPLLVHELLPNGVPPASPFFSFVHCLYIYPYSVDFTKYRLDGKQKLKPRNILLEVTTREENGTTIPRIYPPHYSQPNASQKLQSSYYCSVTYDSKMPLLFDEIKIALPLPIKSHQQRIIFNFYHLTVEKASKRRKTLDENGNVPKILIGTCELSMYELVQRSEQTQNLSIPLQKPNQIDTKQSESRGNVFKVTTQLESTIYPREQSLSSFFKDCSPFLNVIDKERTPHVDLKFISDALKKAINAMTNLMKLPFNRILSHYTLIIDMLVSIICRIPDILKNFVETMDVSSKPLNDTQAADSSKSASGNDPTENSLSVPVKNKNRHSVVADLGTPKNSRGSVKVDQIIPSLTAITEQKAPETAMKKNRFSFIQRRKSSKADTSPMELNNVNVAKPGDSNFDLRAFLTAQSEAASSPTTTTVPTTPPQNAPVDDKKKRRFSIFNFNQAQKKEEPLFSAASVQSLDELVERQEQKDAQKDPTDNNIVDDLSDFLNVSSHLFHLQNLAFQGLVTLFKGACYFENTSDRDNRLLSSYVQYIFKDVIMTTSPFCFVLCELLTNILSTSDSSIIVNAVIEETEETSSGVGLESQKMRRILKRMTLGASESPTDIPQRISTQMQSPVSENPQSYKNIMGIMASESPMFYESLQMCWFWFQIILKSFMISVRSELNRDSFYGALSRPVNYSKQADKLFTLLRDLLKVLADKVNEYKDDPSNSFLSHSINIQIGYLLQDLMSCGMFPPEYVFQLMDAYLVALDEQGMNRGKTPKKFMNITEASSTTVPASLVALKIELFRVLCEHHQFLAWNNSAYHPKDFIRESYACPPVKLLTICTRIALESFQNNEELHTLSYKAVEYQLSWLEQRTILQNSNEQEEEKRKKELEIAARVFFPYVYILITKYDALLSLGSKQAVKEHLKCAAFIMANLSEKDLGLLLLGKVETETNNIPSITSNNGSKTNHPEVSPIYRHQFIAFLGLIAASFSAQESSSKGSASPSTSEAVIQKSVDVYILEISFELFSCLANDVDSWTKECEIEENPVETNYSQFLQSSASNKSLVAHIVFYISTLFQRMVDIPQLKEKLLPKLDSILKLVEKLIQAKLISTNCYCKWLYAAVIANFQFIIKGDSNSSMDANEKVFANFLEHMLALLCDIYGNKIASNVDQLPPVLEEFVVPSNISTTVSGSHDDSSDLSASLSSSMPLSTSHHSTSSPKDSALRDDASADKQSVVVEYDEHGLVKSGTLEQLIWRLVNQESQADTKYADMFFLTYRSFCTPYQVLNHIMAQFKHIASDMERWKQFTVLRLLNSIKSWMTTHPYDFTLPIYANLFIFLKRDVVEFAANLEQIYIVPEMGSNPKTASAYLSLAARLRDGIVSALLTSSDSKDNSMAMAQQYSFSTKPPQPIYPATYSDKDDAESVAHNDKIPILEWSPLEIARQMTLIEYQIFSQIKPRECFGLGWSKADKHIRSPNIVQLVDQFNKTSQWIATMIVKEDTPKKRATVIKHWIDVAKECRDMNNLNGVNSIVSALNNSAIHRLKKSWEQVSQKRMKIFKDLMDLVSISGNYKAMRNAIVHINPPCIPYIGIYLTDLTFIEDGNKDMTRNNLINVAKRRHIARIISNIRLLQQTPYQVIPIPCLRSKLLACDPIMDVDTLYNKSLIVEPREQQQ